MNDVTATREPARDTHYRAYLLRLWRSDQPDTTNWRASLEDPRTGKRVGFATLEALFDYLIEEVEGRH